MNNEKYAYQFIKFDCCALNQRNFDSKIEKSKYVLVSWALLDLEYPTFEYDRPKSDLKTLMDWIQILS